MVLSNAAGFKDSLVMTMTYTLSESQKATLTLQGRKAANRQLWAAEKADRKALSVWEAKKPRKAKKVAKKMDKLKAASIQAVYDSVSQTHTRTVKVLPTKPVDSKAVSASAKSLKRKANKGPKDSNGKLEAQAQKQSLRQAQTRAAKAVKTEVVEDITGHRTEVEVTPKNPTKAHTITKMWCDFSEVPEGLDMGDAVRWAALQDGYGQAADEVSMDDCL